MPIAAAQLMPMTESSPTPAGQVAPRDGDIIVTRERKSAVHYTVRQLPSLVAQISASTRDEAVQHARSFAVKHGFDIWYTEDAETYRLLEAYRQRSQR